LQKYATIMHYGNINNANIYCDHVISIVNVIITVYYRQISRLLKNELIVSTDQKSITVFDFLAMLRHY